MLVFLVLGLIFLAAYAGAPKWIQVILAVANLFIPDPIPLVDEVVMVAIMLKG